MISTTKRLLINEWLTSSHDSLCELSFDDTAVETIFEFLEIPDSDLELLKAITKKLYELYQTGRDRLRLLTLIFLPPLVAIQIRVVHNYYSVPKSEFSSLAVLLLAVYNCEIMEPLPESTDAGRLRTIDIRVISLAKPSIYHEPNSHTQSSTNVSIPTEKVLARINNPNESKISIFGPNEEVEQLVAANYMAVCTVLLKVYNHHISQVGAFSHGSLCGLYLRLLKQGTNIDIKEKIGEYLADTTNLLGRQQQQLAAAARHHVPQHRHRLPNFVLPRNSVQIQFSSMFLVELTKSMYYCLYNDMPDIANKVLDLIAERATLKLFGDVLLMVNAIKNSIAIKRDRDGSVEGTAEAMTNPTKAHNGAAHTTSMNSLNSFSGPESKWTNVRRTAITTASFKTRKLPDDIPIVPLNQPTTPGGTVPPASGQGGQKGSTPPANQSQSTPPTPPAANHHMPHHLMMQNSKNLDSIDEESAERLLANGDSGKPAPAVVKKPTKKNAVMNLLKELKDSKPKLPKMGSGKENGKLQNNSNANLTSHHNHSKDRDSDTTLSDGCTRLSLGDGDDDLIPMRRLNKFIDDDTGDDENDDGDGELEEFNGQLDHHRTLGDDDEESSDRSGASSKGLLASKKSTEGKSSASLKLSVP